jgi:hypothetical protein
VADTLRVGGRASGAGDSYGNTPWIVNALDQRRGGPDDNEAQAGHLVAYVKATKAHGPDELERWEQADVTGVLDSRQADNGHGIVLGSHSADDPLLPVGLDSHRYRCCGNGVVADVAEWLGLRLAGLL